MVTHCMVCLMVGINWDLKLKRFQGDPDLVKCNICEIERKSIVKFTNYTLNQCTAL